MTINDIDDWTNLVDSQFSNLLEPKKTTGGYASKLTSKLHAHLEEQGGTFAVIQGACGSGKTGVLLACGERILDNHPEDLVFLNECFDAPAQFCKLPKSRVHLMVQDDCVQFVDRIKKEPAFPDVTQFTDFKDCYSKAVQGKINVVFFEERKMVMEWIAFLRGTMDWSTVLIDELSEVCQSFASGSEYKRIERFSFVLKDTRKALINLYATVQSTALVDFKCLQCSQVFIFMPGSKAYKHSRIQQKLLDSLKENKVLGNEGIIEGFGVFCKARFSKIYTPNSQYMLHASLKEVKHEE